MNRALVVGSQIEQLKGVENDAHDMASMLNARGFEIDLRIGDAATRDGILAGYDALIEASEAGDAAVFYYSGHGFYATSAEKPQSWQCIVPTDLPAGTTHHWRGITAWELSIKQAQLTGKTRNVTVILDCCHSSQMSRDAAVRNAIPRALPHPVDLGFQAHLEALRTRYGDAYSAVRPAGNRDAVRLVACGQLESAYEYEHAAGQFRGAFTEALLEILQQVGGAQISWAAIAGAIRARVLRKFVMQRPEVEGPAHRRLFSLIEDDDSGIVAISRVADGFHLPAGQLTGVVLGDTYGVMPVGSRSFANDAALAVVKVVGVTATSANARLEAWRNGHTALPIDAVAIPIEKHAALRVVALDVPQPAARAQVEQVIASSRTLQVAGPSEAGAALATLRLVNHALTIEDAWGPLFPAMRFPEHLEAAVKNLANLGVAQAVRELEGEHGVTAHDLAIEMGTVENARPRRLPDHGAALGLRDRIYVQIENRSQRQLFIHVFNIGVRGTVTLLTRDLAPAGVALAPGDPPFVLGQGTMGVLDGLELGWPEGLPTQSFPRIDELVVIVTTTQASLQSLETRDSLVPATTRGAGDGLAALLAQLNTGLSRDIKSKGPSDGYHVKRLSYLLHPREGALGRLAFEIDENPSGQAAAREPEAWIARGVDAMAKSPVPVATEVPDAIAIRLADLVVNNNKALFSADVRIDALICTCAAASQAGHATWTQKYASIKSGQRLPLDNGLLFLGPVRNFIDITLFVSRDIEGSLELAKLLATRATSPEVKDATGALLTAAGAVAAPWVTAVGASAVLARMAYELVLAASGTSIGLYRTSFLRRERFGIGRHPAEGLYRAQDFSFSLLIEPVELQPPLAPMSA
jgi:hypothetical protein